MNLYHYNIIKNQKNMFRMLQGNWMVWVSLDAKNIGNSKRQISYAFECTTIPTNSLTNQFTTCYKSLIDAMTDTQEDWWKRQAKSSAF